MLTLLATALVVCAPGYPGSAAEAQPAMDALAKELSKGTKVTATYEETAEGGLQKLKSPDAGLLLATLASFVVFLPLTALALNGGQPISAEAPAPALSARSQAVLLGLWTVTAWAGAGLAAAVG